MVQGEDPKPKLETNLENDQNCSSTRLNRYSSVIKEEQFFHDERGGGCHVPLPSIFIRIELVPG